MTEPSAIAIDVVAREALWLLLNDSDLSEYILWEDYPEIGEFDFDYVLERVREIAPQRPLEATFRAAYATLAARTTEES